VSFYLALLHYPVYNKNREIIVTSIVIHDIHDIARCGRTYGAKKFYIVQPFKQEQEIVNRIMVFWNSSGKSYNPNRSDAISIVSVKDNFENVLQEIRDIEKVEPVVVGTSAQNRGKTIPYKEVTELEKEKPVLLVFGTGWGIAKELESKFDYFLPPIKGKTDFNHLSVRSAAAIIMDRLFGQ
jgi:hypothetical protein